MVINKVGLREPVAVEVAGMNHACNLLAALDFLHGHVVGLGLQNQPVHGVDVAARLAAVVGRQSDGVALPLGGQRLGVRRELAANAVGIRRQKGRAQPVAEVAELVIVHVEHLLCAGQIGRGQHVYIALAGKVGGDLQNLHAAAGRESDAGELRLGGADSRRG